MSEPFKSLEEIKEKLERLNAWHNEDLLVHSAICNFHQKQNRKHCNCGIADALNVYDRLSATLQTHELKEKGEWQKYLALDETVDGSFNVFVRDNGKMLGDIYREVDGYFVFESHEIGCWYSHYLKMIAEILDEKNKEWDEHVKKELQ